MSAIVEPKLPDSVAAVAIRFGGLSLGYFVRPELSAREFIASSYACAMKLLAGDRAVVVPDDELAKVSSLLGSP